MQGRALKQAGLSKRGFGLVKVIFLHEEKGMKRQEMPRVTRWNIPHADGNYLAIVVGRGQDGPDSRLVSMFVDSPEGPVSPKRNRPESLLPSARLGEGYMADGLGVLSDSASPDGKNSIAESSASVVSPNRNTSQEISRFTPDGQDGVIENISSGSRIDVDSASVNVRAVSDFTAPAPKTVIKSVYQEKTGGIGKRLDRKKEPVREGGHSSISVGDESPLAAGRLSDLQTDSVALNISTSRSIVNVAEFHSDFTAPAPKTVIKSVNLVIVSRKGMDGPDSRLVSMYIGEPDQESSKRKVSSIPSSRWLAVDKDTSQGSTISTPDGRGDKIEEIFSDLRIDTKSSSVKTSPPLNVTVPLSETKLRQNAMPQARDKDPASAANGESAAVKSGRQRFWRRLWGKLFGAE